MEVENEEPGSDEQPDPDAAPKATDPAHDSFPIVGIGASAGGVEATRAFFDHLPDDPGMAFVVVQHLDPNRESTLAEILQHRTGMPVERVTDQSEVVPDHVYIIPAGKSLTIEGCTLRLAEPEQPHGKRAPVTLFFRSLAESQKGNAICIVLSGMGSDGAMGLKAIKEKGGVTMVQQPSETQYDSMPRSAIDTGMADVVLPVHELAEKLVAIRQVRPQIPLPAQDGELADDDRTTLQNIFSLLRSEAFHDFSQYKRPTVLRRITRRMQIHQIEEMPAYLRYLQNQPDEVDALFRELLISATSFFRDPEAFEALQSRVIPELFEGRSHKEEVRVWVPGCATGEEAYSVAMALAEETAQRIDPPGVQILATDLDTEALSYAREGLYPRSIEAVVSPERLHRFFAREEGGYRIIPELREEILFASHNLLSDPPFSKLDLITCRNVLIYVQRGVQKKVLELFHYALRSEGYLFLGTSESVDAEPDLFTAVDREHRLFRRRQVATSAFRLSSFPLLGMDRESETKGATGEVARRSRDEQADTLSFEALHRRVLAELAPPSVLVNENYTLLHVSEGAEAFLQFPSGEPTQNLIDVVRDELRVGVRTALFQAFRKGARVEKHVRFELEGTPRTIKLVARPIEGAETDGEIVQVVFEVGEPVEEPLMGESTVEQDEMVEQLEEELQDTREQLSVTIEEYETANEELKASNEDLQVMNEELKSANQELEASKEELHAMNDELETANQELKSKNDELAQVNSDLRNLMTSIEIGVLFLDRELCLQRYTPRIEKLFGVVPADQGRPLADLTHKIDYAAGENLVADVQHVLDELEDVEREVCSEDGRWYLVRLLPYRTMDDKINGVVVTFLDITERKQHLDELARRERQQAVVAELGRHALQESDLQNLIDRAVREVAHTLDVEFCKVLEYRPEHQDLLLKAGTGWKEGYVGQATVSADTGSQAGYTLETDGPVVVGELDTERRFEGPPLLVEHGVTSGMSVVIPGPDRPYGVMGTHTREQRSFTERDAAFLQAVANVLGAAIERRSAEEALRRSEEQYRRIVENVDEYAIFMLDAEGKVATWNEGAGRILGYDEDEVVGAPFATFFPEDDRAANVPEEKVETAKAEGRAFDEAWRVRKNGDRFWARGVLTALRSADGELLGYTKILRDNTERREREEALRKSEERYRLIVENLEEYAIFTLDPEGRVTSWNAAAEAVLGYERSEILGEHSAVIFTGEDREAGVPEREMKTASEEGHASDDRWQRRKDGSRFWASGTMAALRTPDGELRGFVKILRDLTKRKEMGDALRESRARLQELNETLETRVAERTEQVRRLSNALARAEQKERQRISQILHDHLQQQLQAMQIWVSTLRRDPAAEKRKELADNVHETLENAIDTSRTLTVELTPPVLKGDSLAPALEWLALHMEETYSLTVDLDCPDSFRAPSEELALLLFQVTRELLFNIVKHAGVEKAEMRCTEADGRICIEVEDNGAGFDPQSLDGEETNGFGLFSIRDRLDLIGGKLKIESAPGKGTCMTVIAPPEG